VTLTVDDGDLSDSATATVTVYPMLPARAFVIGGGGAIRLGSAKPTASVEIEPVDRSFDISDVDLTTISMKSSGTGSVDQIDAVGDKTILGPDRDRNGIQEITATFAKEELRKLFSGLPTGRTTVNVTLAGRLISGGEFRGDLALAVIQSSELNASVSPNPILASATLTFRTASAGPARVSIYGISGRLMEVLMDEAALSAGYHDISIGAEQFGERLPAGIYFYRIQTGSEVTAGRFSIVR